MLLPHRFETRIRHTSLGRHGQLPVGGWMRLFEEGRWSAFTAAGGVGSEQSKAADHWVVRAQQVGVLAPVCGGERVAITVGVQRVGRTSLDFGQLVTRVSDGAALAAARVTAVHISPRFEPLPVPDGARGQLAPQPLDLPPLPTGAPMGEPSFRATGHARPSDLDYLQHVNQARYADLVGDALVAGGVDAPLTGVALSYDREVRAGDVLEWSGWAAGPSCWRLMGAVGGAPRVGAVAWVG